VHYNLIKAMIQFTSSCKQEANWQTARITSNGALLYFKACDVKCASKGSPVSHAKIQMSSQDQVLTAEWLSPHPFQVRGVDQLS
jgi:hypothetical protein